MDDFKLNCLFQELLSKLGIINRVLENLLDILNLTWHELTDRGTATDVRFFTKKSLKSNKQDDTKMLFE